MIQAFVWTVQKCQESIQIHRPVNSADCSELRTDSTSTKRRERLEEPEGHVQRLAIMIVAAAAMRAESEAVAVAALPAAIEAAGVEEAEVIEAAEDMAEEGGRTRWSWGRPYHTAVGEAGQTSSPVIV